MREHLASRRRHPAHLVDAPARRVHSARRATSARRAALQAKLLEETKLDDIRAHQSITTLKDNATVEQALKVRPVAARRPLLLGGRPGAARRQAWCSGVIVAAMLCARALATGC